MNMLGDDQMSDYLGSGTLESWLAEEVFETSGGVDANIVVLFEKWREAVESNIERFQAVQLKGDPISWRAWGRGFDAIPDDDAELFDAAEQMGREMMRDE